MLARITAELSDGSQRSALIPTFLLSPRQRHVLQCLQFWRQSPDRTACLDFAPGLIAMSSYPVVDAAALPTPAPMRSLDLADVRLRLDFVADLLALAPLIAKAPSGHPELAVLLGRRYAKVADYFEALASAPAECWLVDVDADTNDGRRWTVSPNSGAFLDVFRSDNAKRSAFLGILSEARRLADIRNRGFATRANAFLSANGTDAQKRRRDAALMTNCDVRRLMRDSVFATLGVPEYDGRCGSLAAPSLESALDLPRDRFLNDRFRSLRHRQAPPCLTDAQFERLESIAARARSVDPKAEVTARQITVRGAGAVDLAHVLLRVGGDVFERFFEVNSDAVAAKEDAMATA